MDWRARFDSELERAASARARANEGQARVCARRAAGIAAREYLRRHGVELKTGSVGDLLRRLAITPSTPSQCLPLLDHLLQQVDTNFRLAPEIDLLAEARLLRQLLLPD